MNRLLEQCKAALSEHYRAKLAGVVLYGSMARGDGRADSDVDLLVLLHPPLDYFVELRRIVDLLYPLQLASDHLISARPADVTEFEKGAIQLYRNTKAEGVFV